MNCIKTAGLTILTTALIGVGLIGCSSTVALETHDKAKEEESAAAAVYSPPGNLEYVPKTNSCVAGGYVKWLKVFGDGAQALPPERYDEKKWIEFGLETADGHDFAVRSFHVAPSGIMLGDQLYVELDCTEDEMATDGMFPFRAFLPRP